MTTTVIAVRHGETEWNAERRTMGHLDSPLTPRGIREAAAIATRLRALPVAAVYSSDLGRARTTAGLIAAEFRLSVQVDPALRERHLGVFQGLTQDEQRARFPDERAAHERLGDAYAPPAGESGEARRVRSMGAMNAIAARHPGDTVVVVGHDGMLASLLETTLALPAAARPHYARGNARLNVFTCVDGAWRLEVWGA